MSAIFSPCGLYRYRLDRDGWLGDGRTIAFVLHNPSTAGAENDDPTSTRGIGFVRAWGASRLIFINPWAGCATKPADLWKMANPIGPENNDHIVAVALEVAESGGFFVFAWGAVNPPARMRGPVMARLASLDHLIRGICPDIRALGVTKDGAPRHPLYMPAGSVPMPWPSTPQGTGGRT